MYQYLDRDPRYSIILPLVVCGYAGTRLGMILGVGRPHWLSVTYWVFAYVWIGVAGFAQQVTGRWPSQFRFDSDTLLWSNLWILCGFVCWDIGTSIGLCTKVVAARQSWALREIQPRRVWLLAVAVIASVPVLVPKLGGVVALLTSREAVQAVVAPNGIATEGKAGLALVQAGLTGSALVALLGIVAVLRADGVRWRAMTLGAGVTFAAIIGVNVIVNNPISNPRFWAGTAAIAVLLLTRSVHSPSGVRVVTTSMILIGSIAFPYLAYFRYSDKFVKVNGFLSTLQTKGDYDASALLPATIEYVDKVDYTYGGQALGTLLFFVPRALWPEKPIDTGRLIAQTLDLPYENISGPLWTEAYINFGLVGIAVTCMAAGYLTSRLDQRFEQHRSGLILVLVPLLAGYELILLRGSLLQAMGRLVVLLALLLLITKRPSRSRRPSGQDDLDSPSVGRSLQPSEV